MGGIKKFLTLGLMIIVVGAGAIATGKYLSSVEILRPAPHNAAEKQQQKEAKTIQKQMERADYLAAPPTFGPIIQTLDISAVYSEENDKATAIVRAEDAHNIRPRQDVVLYDQEGYVLPLGGVVDTIERQENNQIKVTINLPEGTNTEMLSEQISIITLETIASKRLPTEALQTDDNNQTYVWIAETDNSEENSLNKVRRQYIDAGLKEEDFFTENGHIIDSDTLVIINPDNKINSKATYDIFVTEIAGPLHNPIRQAYIDFELRRLAQQQEELLQIAEDCENGVRRVIPASGDSTPFIGAQSGGSACGGGATDPMAIFNSLLNQQNNGSACGTSCQ